MVRLIEEVDKIINLHMLALPQKNPSPVVVIEHAHEVPQDSEAH
jgi:hypothetical protein